MSANFRPYFVPDISYWPTDLSLLKGFSKNFNFEDFHNFHEICHNGGHELGFSKYFSFEDFHNFHEICHNGGHELAFLQL